MIQSAIKWFQHNFYICHFQAAVFVAWAKFDHITEPTVCDNLGKDLQGITATFDHQFSSAKYTYGYFAGVSYGMVFLFEHETFAGIEKYGYDEDIRHLDQR